MHPSDLIVLIAETLPLEQAIDLVKWYTRRQLYEERLHPSVNWWIGVHAHEIATFEAAKYWAKCWERQR